MPTECELTDLGMVFSDKRFLQEVHFALCTANNISILSKIILLPTFFRDVVCMIMYFACVQVKEPHGICTIAFEAREYDDLAMDVSLTPSSLNKWPLIWILLYWKFFVNFSKIQVPFLENFVIFGLFNVPFC